MSLIQVLTEVKLRIADRTELHRVQPVTPNTCFQCTQVTGVGRFKLSSYLTHLICANCAVADKFPVAAASSDRLAVGNDTVP
jgi:hypothetical protein